MLCYISQFSQKVSKEEVCFWGGLLKTPAHGALTGTVRTNNKRLEIRGAKYTLETLLVRQAIVTFGSFQRFLLGQGEFYSCAVCF